MPFQLTDIGLQIQTLAEQTEALKQAFRAAWGDNLNLRSDSVLGQLIGIVAERLVVHQHQLLQVYSAFSPQGASGVQLDLLSLLTATFRKPATHSRALGRFHGTPGTEIVDGNLVQLVATQSSWAVVDGPYVVGPGGWVDGTIEAVEPGPVHAYMTGQNGWDIQTPVAGWQGFETLQDAILGALQESDEELRARRLLDLRKGGNDLDSIRAGVLAVPGVTLCHAYENVSLDTDENGLPGKAFEVIVEGGEEQAIAEAIYVRKPAGILAFGLTFSIDVPDDQGGAVTIMATRPELVELWVVVDLTVNGEDLFPPFGEDLIRDKLVEFGHATQSMGDDVIPDVFIGPVYETLGNKSVTNVVVKLSLTGFNNAADQVIALNIRKRAVFDPARIKVNQV